MKLKKIPTATILALVTLTGSAFAQAGAAVNSATSAATNTAATARAPAPAAVNPPTTPAVNPPTAPTVNAPAAPTVNSSAAGSMSAGASSTSDAVNSSLSGSAAATGDVNSRGNVNADARSNAAGQINSMATGSELSAGLSASLNPANTVRDIRSATFETRETLSSQVNSNLDSSGKALADIRRTGRELKGDARTQFNAAYDDVQAKEKALKRSLNDARRASNDTWSNAQEKLASDYEAYTAAVARAEAAAAASASASGSTGITK